MKKISALILLVIFTGSCTEKSFWPIPTRESKPWTRWWWMGNAVDRENISRELKEMKKAGIGGVEITPIYGVKGEEKRFIEYLSPKFSEMLQFTIDQADKLGMGVDLPPGSGWRCGGPFVPEEKGLWNLAVEKSEVKKGSTWRPVQNIEKIVAVSFLDSKGNRGIIDLNNPVWTATENALVYVARLRKSGDKVKRASEGGTGWAIDTFNKEITDWYLEEFRKRLSISDGRIRCFFHDSFEYTGDITTSFMAEFQRRRGYDLAEYLYVLNGDCNDEELASGIRSDYRETLADLVLESFIEPMTEWANKHKSMNRNQAHGSPGNILDLYAACDIPETEIFRTVAPNSTDVFVNKFASSAAHVTGKKLVSSESFTWLDEHWKVTPSQMMRATNRFFLAGINHMFFHGTCYSPADAEWPGWLFYASTQVNNRNPLWPELPAIFSYITSSQSILQQSKPVNDLLVYWPYYDVIAEPGSLFNHIGVSSQSGWFASHSVDSVSRILLQNGYTFDYISDRQLLECIPEGGNILTSGKSSYKAIIIPECRFIPVSTFEKLAGFILKGGKVYFSGILPSNVPGLGNLIKRKSQFDNLRNSLDFTPITGNILNLLKANKIIGEESLVSNGFFYNKLDKDGETWYQVFNCTDDMHDAFVKLNTNSISFLLLDPMTQKAGIPDKEGNSVRIQLAPERSVFVRCSNQELKAKPFDYFENSGSPDLLEGKWSVKFIAGGPEMPDSYETDTLQSWTEQSGSKYSCFAGTARYSLDFEYQGDDKKATLDLGKVLDCARVKINGKDFGVLPGPGFTINIDNLRKGNNHLEVEVTNVAANRIRDLDKRGVVWRKFYDINFVNIEYKPFDASGWEVTPAGLLGPVVLTSFE